MKKNRFLKVASAMIILCLITTCAVSTTFAKYTTAGSATDAARVAKWGITMDAGVSAFSESYTNVQSEGGAVVAPGTDGYRVYEVNGTPEVAYVITFAYADLKEVFLKAGTYNYNDAEGRIEYVDAVVTETKNGNYYPIKYTVALGAPNATYGKADDAKVAIENSTSVTFDTLAEALDAIANTTLTYGVNEAADCDLRISWAWAFDTTASSHIQDAGDTVLGDLIAGNTDLVFPAADDYNLTIAYKLTMTATQID